MDEIFHFSLSRGEHMAVRNADGGFFLCVSMQNVYKKAPSVVSKKVTIQWLSEAPEDNPDKDIYVPEYYDKTGESARETDK